MKELDPEEEAVLESARRALSPATAVTQRMRAALLVKIAAPGIAVGASAAASSAAAASSTAAASGAAAAAAASVATATAGGAAPLAAVAGGAVAGAKLAVGAGLMKAALGVTTAVLLATATSPYWLPEPTPTATAPAAPALVTPAPRTSTGRARSAPAAPVPKGLVAPSQQPARDGVTSQAPAEVARRAAPVTDTPQQKLQVELDLLKRSQQALQAGQAQLALDLLAKLDAQHPKSSLGQEREVARVLALCGVGRVAAARQVAQRVLAASPNSLYAGRIQASCAALPSKSSAQAPVAGPGKSTSATPPVARFGDSGN